MGTLATSLVSSSARPLPWRMRLDLTSRRHRYQGEIYWVVKEPIGLHYFRFQEEEFAILELLDGRRSLDDLKAAFEERFPPQKITVEELGSFVGMLHRSNLLVSDAPGQGLQLRKRGDEKRWEDFVQMVSNVLAIRFKGIDPDRLLNWLEPRTRWFWTTPAVVFFCLLGFSALSLVLVQFDQFQAKLPTFHQFFAASNWIYLGITLCVTKVLHEFGHGLSCKHFGGECHEMGVLLLVMTPCLYCNVSDSWMLPNKWHRAAIGAAGMYVELCLASIATFVWWFSTPNTLLNQICLSTMFVCSVSTIMFNANPLLRYDGYYILSDISEIPNLRQKATSILGRKAGEWCLGLEEPEDPFLPQRNQLFFAAYSVAATIYSWVVAISILWFLNQVFKPYHLEVLGKVIALGALWGLAIQPSWKLYKFMSVPGRGDTVKKPRLYATLGVVAVILATVIWLPLPHRIMCTLEIQPRDAASICVLVPGSLQSINVRPGQRVEAGTVLATLQNIDLQLTVKDLQAKRSQLAAQLDSLQRYTGNAASDARSQIPQIQESLEGIDQQLQEKTRDIERLKLITPIAGTIIPPPAVAPREDEDGKLPTWNGTPLEKRNLGAQLQENSVFCQVGDPMAWDAILVIDQADIDFIKPDQTVDIKLDELPHQTFTTEIGEIANQDLKVTPKQLSNKSGGEMVTKTDAGGVERPLNTSYQARAPLDDVSNQLLPGLRGRAKIHAGNLSIGDRLWRYLSQTFNFKM